jgi:hypothetical protein
MHSASDSARYDEAGMVKPKNSRSGSGTGSVIDPRSKYPSTHTFASSEEENISKVNAGRMSRRPSGSLRARRGLGCTCGSHPCKCGTSCSKEHIIHENVNE